MKKWIVTQDFCTVLYSYSLQNKMSTCAFKYIDDRHRKTFFLLEKFILRGGKGDFDMFLKFYRELPDLSLLSDLWPAGSFTVNQRSCRTYSGNDEGKKKKKILYLWTNKEVLGSFSYNIPILYYVKHDIMKMQMVYSSSPEGSADINVSMTTRWCITIRNHFREVSVFYKTLVQNCNYTVTTWPIWFSLSTQVRPNFK